MTPLTAAGHGRRDILEYVAVGLLALAAASAAIVAVPGLHGLLGAGLALLMLAIAAIDARHFIIPDELTAAALGLGLVNAATQEADTVLAGLGSSVLRGAVLAACFLAVRAGYFRLRGRQGLGLGDVKLAGAAGVWLGWTMMPVAVEIAALAAIALYALRQFLGGRPISATGRLPFGLFLAPTIWICWLLESVLLAP